MSMPNSMNATSIIIWHRYSRQLGQQMSGFDVDVVPFREPPPLPPVPCLLCPVALDCPPPPLTSTRGEVPNSMSTKLGAAEGSPWSLLSSVRLPWWSLLLLLLFFHKYPLLRELAPPLPPLGNRAAFVLVLLFRSGSSSSWWLAVVMVDGGLCIFSLI